MEVITQDGLYGLRDGNGNIVLPVEYDGLEIEYDGFIFSDSSVQEDSILFILAKKNGRMGIVGKEGNVVLPIEYDEITSISVSFIDASYIAKKRGKFGVVGKDGSIALPVEYDSIREDGEGFLIVSKGSKKGLVNRYGSVILPAEYDDYCYNKSLGCYIVTNNGKKGIYCENRMLTECIYDEIFIDDGLFIIEYVIGVKKDEYSLIHIKREFDFSVGNITISSIEVLPKDENGVYSPDGSTLLFFLKKKPFIKSTVKYCRTIQEMDAIDTIVFAEGHAELNATWNYGKEGGVPCLKEIIMPSTIKRIDEHFFSDAFPKITVPIGMVDYFKKIVPKRLKDNIVEQK